MEERAADIVHEAFPGATVERVHDRSGMAHRTVVADLDGAPVDRAVARWCVHDHLAARFQREAAVLRHVGAETELPVPEVLAEADGAVLLEFLPGTHRSNRFWRPHDLAAVELDSAGKTLARLHRALPRDDTGPAVPAGPGRTLAVQEEGWPGFLHRTASTHLDQLADLDDYRFADLLPALRDAVEDHVARAAAPDPALLHRDFRPANLLFRDGAVAGVVDWERAVAGDPLYDLVKAEMNFAAQFPAAERERRWDAFLRGYRGVRPVPEAPDRTDLYRFLHVLEILWAAPLWMERERADDRERIEQELRAMAERRMAAL